MRRIWDLLPIRLPGLILLAVALWVALRFSRDQADYLLHPAALGAVGLVAVCAISVTLGALVLRRRLRAAEAGLPETLETGVTTHTDFRCPRFAAWPLIEVHMRWAEPAGVTVELEPGARRLRRERDAEAARAARARRPRLHRRGRVRPDRRALPRRLGTAVRHRARLGGGLGGARRQPRARRRVRLAHRARRGRPRRDARATATAIRCATSCGRPSRARAACSCACPSARSRRSRSRWRSSSPGPGDEPTAAAARLYLERGMLGPDFIFAADGAPRPTRDPREALDQIIDSAAAARRRRRHPRRPRRAGRALAHDVVRGLRPAARRAVARARHRVGAPARRAGDGGHRRRRRGRRRRAASCRVSCVAHDDDADGARARVDLPALRAALEADGLRVQVLHRRTGRSCETSGGRRKHAVACWRGRAGATACPAEARRTDKMNDDGFAWSSPRAAIAPAATLLFLTPLATPAGLVAGVAGTLAGYLARAAGRATSASPPALRRRHAPRRRRPARRRLAARRRARRRHPDHARPRRHRRVRLRQPRRLLRRAAPLRTRARLLGARARRRRRRRRPHLRRPPPPAHPRAALPLRLGLVARHRPRGWCSPPPASPRWSSRRSCCSAPAAPPSSSSRCCCSSSAPASRSGSSRDVRIDATADTNDLGLTKDEKERLVGVVGAEAARPGRGGPPPRRPPRRRRAVLPADGAVAVRRRSARRRHLRPLRQGRHRRLPRRRAAAHRELARRIRRSTGASARRCSSSSTTRSRSASRSRSRCTPWRTRTRAASSPPTTSTRLVPDLADRPARRAHRDAGVVVRGREARTTREIPADPRYNELADKLVRDVDPRFVGDDVMTALAIKRYLEKNGFYSLKEKKLVGNDPTAQLPVRRDARLLRPLRPRGGVPAPQPGHPGTRRRSATACRPAAAAPARRC